MKNCKFLIVENSETSKRMLSDIMRSEGWTDICLTSTATEALEILKTAADQAATGAGKLVDVIITSLVLQGIDGIELCRQIKGEPKLADIPIIMITSAKDSKIQVEAFQSGISDYIKKPFNAVLVLARIKAVLRLKEEMDKRRNREKTLEQYNNNLVKDLQVAQQLQKNMLPPPLVHKNIAISGCYAPMEFLGGDLYYWDMIDDNRYGIVLLDVMGHGTATSMICMYLRSILPKLVKTMTSVNEMAEKLNTIMLDFNQQISSRGYYFTAFYMIVDTVNKTIEYVNAGVPPAAFVEGSQKVRWLEEGSPPLGLFPKLPIRSQKIHFEDSAKLVVYSDGIYELFKEINLDMEYLLNYLRVYGKTACDATTVVEKFGDFIKLLPCNDDISLVCVALSE
ncbi:Phosphoserine phosphatase RsbP [Sporomusa ovata DSM 2662]|uniref:Serine phosphatase RsbU, regulator of sigma subunit n=1 Tax=Sporomusa ovata TaxID=2378 RepID=A0A0U1KTI0_9FIRM|nr:fused response regulator/phosphatase [Sporomusa ovata]EQB26648.1 phosphoserine phosphatase RsbP [Sporomusa ovata DSM 2662]CQR70740.1 Serine phosphatase RsbU, regulator of sigma subunit [Sporomusa ovata]